MASGGDSGDGKGHEPRVPKDMKGLLQYCITAAGTESESDTQSGRTFEPMSEERRQWLEKALDEMSVSPVQRMKSCVSVLLDEKDDDETVEKKLNALDETMEWCEQIDFAIDFHKTGGFNTFDKLLDDPEPEIRWKTLELIATLVQNNPYCQKAILEFHYVPVLIKILDTDHNSTVKVKALYALSCLTRNDLDCQNEFSKHDGFSTLMRAMQTDVEKLKIKAAFMLSSICSDRPEFKDTLCNMGMIEQLVGHLTEKHSNFHEHLMSAILCVITDHEPSIQECLKQELNFPRLLRERITFLEGKVEFEEEKNYAGEILKLICSNDHEEIVR